MRILPSSNNLDETRELLDDIMNVQVKKALDLPTERRWQDSNGAVFSALNGDFMKPVTNIGKQKYN